MDYTEILAEIRRKNIERLKSAQQSQEADAKAPQNAQDLLANAEKYHREMLERTRKANQRGKEKFDQMHANSDSCVIHGKAANCSCNNDRLWLSYDIYEHDKELDTDGNVKKNAQGETHSAPIQKQFVPYLEDVHKRWTYIDEKTGEKEEYFDLKHNFKARFYRVKQGECEPSLIFRGSVGQMEGFALYYCIDVKEMLTGSKIIDNHSDTLTFSNADPHDKDMMHRSEYRKTVLLDEEGGITPQLPGWLGGALNIADFLAPYGMPPLCYYHITCILGVKDGKCWATDILQALGFKTAQYKKAQEKGQEIANRIIDEKIGGGREMYCAGHSLGGGLAAAAAHAADYAAQQQNKRFNVTSVTYNAAGLHSAALLDGIKYGSVLCFAHSIDDEALTTLQSFQEKLPFLKKLLQLAHIKLPEAYGCKYNYPPLHPCPVMDDLPKRQDNFCRLDRYAPRAMGDPLPKLWPLDEQTLIEGQKFPEIARLDTLFTYSHTAGDALQKALDYIYGRYSYKIDAVRPKKWDPRVEIKEYWQQLKDYYYKEVLLPELNDAKRILAASGDYHGMDVVAQSIFMAQEAARSKARQAQTFSGVPVSELGRAQK